jgi:hypothetical protein
MNDGDDCYTSAIDKLILDFQLFSPVSLWTLQAIDDAYMRFKTLP